MTGFERLRFLAGRPGTAGELLRQIGVTGLTAGALLVSYSGLASATAAVHILHDRPKVGEGKGFAEVHRRGGASHFDEEIIRANNEVILAVVLAFITEIAE